jgi:hypothetical protein
MDKCPTCGHERPSHVELGSDVSYHRSRTEIMDARLMHFSFDGRMALIEAVNYMGRPHRQWVLRSKLTPRAVSRAPEGQREG